MKVDKGEEVECGMNARWSKLLLELRMDSRNIHLVDRMAVTSVCVT